MVEKQVRTFTIKLYLSGPIEIAKQVAREYCLKAGLCVTIDPTLFIYTGGEESGYVVGLLNYPRFPTTEAALEEKAEELMHRLLVATAQHSALLVTPYVSKWVSYREEAK